MQKEPVNVYILTGFVGAGKTTLLNHLLRLDQIITTNPALIINEFGSLGVDGALVEKSDLKRYEINKGSIFCICTKTDFLKALAEIAESGRHRSLIIEATGIAETCDIESFLDAPHIADSFKICGNLCVIDAVDFTRVAAYLKPAKTQVCTADLLIINKCDRVNKTELATLRQILKALNPGASQIETEFGKIDSNVLDQIQHLKHGSEAIEVPPVDIIAVSISTKKQFDRSKFLTVLEELKENILRLKGNIDFVGQGIRFVEVAGRNITERQGCQELAKQNGMETAFTTIAWKIDTERLKKLLLKCSI